MTFTLPDLPYDYNALEPYIDSKTMEIHHSKHHAGYVKKLNKALEGTEHEEKSLEELLQSIDIFPDSIRTAVRNNGGGHWNHSLFWQLMTPDGHEMSDRFEDILEEEFGDEDTFFEKFSDMAASNFGSGRTWLVKDGESLEIMNTPNQDNPLMKYKKPILGIDVWEHAYYLKHQNRRPEYIKDRRKVVNWAKVEELYDS